MLTEANGLLKMLLHLYVFTIHFFFFFFHLQIE